MPLLAAIPALTPAARRLVAHVAHEQSRPKMLTVGALTIRHPARVVQPRLHKVEHVTADERLPVATPTCRLSLVYSSARVAGIDQNCSDSRRVPRLAIAGRDPLECERP